MIRTYDTLFAFMRRNNVQIEIIKNFDSKEFDKLCYGDTTVYFDFYARKIVIHRDPEDDFTKVKSWDVKLSFNDFIELCKELGIPLE